MLSLDIEPTLSASLVVLVILVVLVVVVIVVTEQSIPTFPESHKHFPVLVSHLPALLQFAGQVNSAKKNIVEFENYVQAQIFNIIIK